MTNEDLQQQLNSDHTEEVKHQMLTDSTDSDNDQKVLIQSKVSQKQPSESKSSSSKDNKEMKGVRRNQVVILIIALCLGFSTFSQLSMNSFFKDVLKLGPAELSLFNSIINFVWILKPIFGFICDSYPIFGSHRKSYLILFSILQVGGWMLLGLWVSNLWQAIFVKTLINICTNFQNVIGEGIMVESSQKQESLESTAVEENESRMSIAKYDNKNSATNVSIYLSLTALSSVLSSYGGGALLSYLTVQQMFMLTSIFPVLTMISGLILYEPKRTVEERQGVNTKATCYLAKQNWRKVWQYLKLSFIYKPIIFIFLVVIAPGVDDPFYYYQSEVLKFDNNDFAYLNVTSSVANIMGVWAYRFFFRNVLFKKMLFFTTVSFAVAQISKLLLTADLTYQIFGISPLVYSFITQWLYTFVNELHLMPIMVLACKMSPKSVEASFYAFILAIINLGYLVSYQMGGLLTWSLNITATDFQNLWILIVIATVFPLATLLFLLLIPSKFDVNEEIEKYFRLRKTKKDDILQTDLPNINLSNDNHRSNSMVSRHSSFVKVRSNIRDEMEGNDYLIDIENKNDD